MQANRALGLLFLLVLVAGAAAFAALYFGRAEVPVLPGNVPGSAAEATPQSGGMAAAGATGEVDHAADGAAREQVADASAGADTPAIVGQIVGEDGLPIADAEVQCGPGQGLDVAPQDFEWDNPDSFDPKAFTERMQAVARQRVAVRSDEAGRFKLVAPGANKNVSLRVLARGHQTLQRQVARPTVADVDLGVLTVQSGAVVSGRVLDPRGNPIAGARVVRMQQFEAGFGDFDVQMPGMDVFEDLRGGDTATTDEMGAFELPHLAAGEFTLRARHPDHPSARSDALNVPKGRSVEGVLITMLPGAEIRGAVLGIPQGVKNVRVVASARRDAQPGADAGPAGVIGVFAADASEIMGDMGLPFGERQVDPDAEGRFVLRGLEQGQTYRLWAVQQGRGFVGGGECSERLEVRSGTANVELHYDAGVTVTFVVLGKGDAPVERLWVRDRLRGGNDGGFAEMIGFGGRAVGRARDYPGGKVTLANLRPKKGQRLQLDVDALGHASWQRQDIELPSVGTLDLGTVRLSPTPVLTVEVVAADAKAPIEGARVRVAANQQDGPRNPFAALGSRRGGQGPTSATTDATGVAEINAIDGAGTLHVTAKGFAAARVPLPANASGAQQVVMLVGGTIEVKVLDPQQRPVANVGVDHRSPDGQTDEQRTDESGIARFRNQTPGAHDVRLAQSGGGMRFSIRLDAASQQLGGGAADAPWTTVSVEDKAIATVTLAKGASATIVGVVRENGVPLVGARISFVEGPGAGGGSPEAAALGAVEGMLEQFGQAGSKSSRSGDDGAFTIAELPAGQHRLRVTHKDRAMPTEMPVVLVEGDNRVDVDLDMTSVRGVVRDPDGNPVSGARVSAKAVRGEGGDLPDVGVMVESVVPGMNFGSGTQQRTDANGAFELRGVEPGVTLQLRASARGFAPAAITVTVARGESKGGADLQLGAAGKIAVTVAGTAGPFAMVSARRVGAEGPQGQPAVQMLRRGKGTLADLEPGLYEVEYRSTQDLQNGGEGQAQKRRVEVKAGQTVSVDF